jgi:alkanesulfonate monooxygenase SsuD/methylene tetrahydromethanopterin reductase-like flavin-dependent oxidoreductase (luciferase family)
MPLIAMRTHTAANMLARGRNGEAVMGIRLGLQLWNQVFDWESAAYTARRAEALGFDHLWSWDHLLAVMGDPHQDVFDPYTLLAAWSQITERVQLGVLTSANTFRNPALLAKTVTTLDHVSRGRAILGLGAGWHEREHHEMGIEFGRGFGQRLDWLDESVAAIRDLLDGAVVSSPDDGHYSFRDARLLPPPLQDRLPILIGGSGEKKTLRTVATYADMWNMVATSDLDRMRHKDEVLRRHCEAVGRDDAEIERTAFLSPVVRDTEDEAMRFFRVQMAANRLDDDVLDDADIYVTTVERMTELVVAWKGLGFSTFIIETAAPFDAETAEIFATEIRPVVDSA